MIIVDPATKSKSSLADAVESALVGNPYLASRKLKIEEGNGAIRIHGRVETFFEKQMAQEVVRRLDGVERVENMLQVAWA